MAAGVAIDNARLYEESRLRERWLQANAEITHSLMSGSERGEVLGLIAERAREITGAALAVVAMPIAEDTEASLSVELAIGSEAETLRGLVLPVDGSLIGAAFSTVAPVTTPDVAQDERVSAGPPRFAGLGPAVAVPVGAGEGGVRGVVLLVREAGQTGVHRGGDRTAARLRGAGRRRHGARGTPAGRRAGRRRSRTATASPGTCTTWRSSGSSPLA